MLPVIFKLRSQLLTPAVKFMTLIVTLRIFCKKKNYLCEKNDDITPFDGTREYRYLLSVRYFSFQNKNDLCEKEDEIAPFDGT
jgi:hypothetical protein